MMKKWFFLFVLFVLLLLFTGCNGEDIPEDQVNTQLYYIYTLALETEAFTGTYEEWLESVRGPQGLPGDDGRSPIFRLYEGYIQWSYEGDNSWDSLIHIQELMGPKGEDGQEVQFQVNGTLLEWQYVGDTSWNMLFDVAILTGKGIAAVMINEDGELIVEFTDLTSQNLGVINPGHLVIFKGMNGFVLDVQYVKNGDDAHPPSPPEEEGYQFVGWNLDTTEITEDRIIFAIYEPLTYRIDFICDCDMTYESLIDVSHGSLIDLPIPTRSGLVFVGWFMGESSNDQKVTSQTPVTKNLTLFAQWQIGIYYVEFRDVNDHIIQQDYVFSGTSITPPDIEMIEGYTFEGWDHSSENILSNLVIRPIFTVNQYPIDFYIYDYFATYKQTLLEPFDEVISIKSTHASTLILTKDHRLFSWGRNVYSELGDGTNVNRFSPTEITSRFPLAEDDYIVQFDANGQSSIARSLHGRIFTWGSNAHGQLGNGTTTSSNTPIEITDKFSLLEDEAIKEVYMSGYSGFALTSKERLFAWGYNSEGSLGDGTTERRLLPVLIDIKSILHEGEMMTSIMMQNHRVIIITSEHRVIGWGDNQNGQLGNGTVNHILSPTDLTMHLPLNDNEWVTEIALNVWHTTYLTSEHRMLSVGNNFFGQLADGTTTMRTLPVDSTPNIPLHPGEFIKKIYPSQGMTSLIETSEGRILSWGRNHAGQVGDGTLITRYTPVDITERVALYPGETIELFTSGEGFVGLITSGHRTIFWGDNSYGQLGDNGAMQSNGRIELSLALSLNEDQQMLVDFGTPLIEYIPQRLGFDFEGWYLDPELNVSFSYEETLMPAHHLILYGKWQLHTYTINYHLNGGQGDFANPQLFTIHDPMIELEDPVFDDYTFAGWYQNPDFSGPQVTYIDPIQAMDYVLYAKFLETEYTVSYHLNGGTLEQSNPTTIKASDGTITLLSPSKEGYVFAGWYVSEDFIGDELITLNVSVGKDVDLYAKWNIITYSITYLLDEGINDPLNPSYYTIESGAVTLIEPTKDGYDFTGWYITVNDIDTHITTIIYGEYEDIILRATWALHDYMVTYILNTDYPQDFIWPETYQIIGDYPIFTPQIDVGLFRGWYDNPTFSGERIVNLYGHMEDYTLYAKWDYVELTSIETLLLYHEAREEQVNSFNATIQGLIYYSNPSLGEYWIYDGTGYLYLQNQTYDLLLGEEYQVTGSFMLYHQTQGYDYPFRPMMHEITSIINLDHGLGLSEPGTMVVDFETLEAIPINDYAYFGQPIRIVGRNKSGESLYDPLDVSQLILMTTYHDQDLLTHLSIYHYWEPIEMTYILSHNFNHIEDSTNIWYLIHDGNRCETRYVEFHHSGTGITSIIGQQGDPIDYEDPILDGYTFEGWYLDQEYTSFYASSVNTIPNDSIILYGKFVINEVS